MGGPLGEYLIKKKNLLAKVKEEDPSILMEETKKHHHQASMYASALYQIAIAVGLGTLISWLLSKTGMTFPVYIGAMIIAALMRNIGEATGKITIHMGEINDIGGICLSVFLGIAMITLKLWQLAELALPMLILLCGQLLLMFLVARFVVFNVMGRDYDAAVLSAGTCGFGMGATPNAMANMSAVCYKYRYAVNPFIIVPIIGAMFVDIINTGVITIFLNIL
jgi:ESS family glutamate:Na+ symporter